MSGHTSGPWRIVIDGTCSGAWPHIGPADVSDEEISDEPIANLPTTHVERNRRGLPGTYLEKPERFKPTLEHDTIIANARLIAAAPELLEVCQRLLNHPLIRITGDVEVPLRRVIAKATGAQA